MTSCNFCQYLGKFLAKIFPRSRQDLAKILLRYPWRVDPGVDIIIENRNPIFTENRFIYVPAATKSNETIFYRNLKITYFESRNFAKTPTKQVSFENIQIWDLDTAIGKLFTYMLSVVIKQKCRLFAFLFWFYWHNAKIVSDKKNPYFSNFRWCQKMAWKFLFFASLLCQNYFE